MKYPAVKMGGSSLQCEISCSKDGRRQPAVSGTLHFCAVRLLHCLQINLYQKYLQSVILHTTQFWHLQFVILLKTDIFINVTNAKMSSMHSVYRSVNRNSFSHALKHTHVLHNKCSDNSTHCAVLRLHGYRWLDKPTVLHTSVGHNPHSELRGVHQETLLDLEQGTQQS